ncbi:MAG: DsbA family protein [Rhodobacteraceae bacterium]|nr:MAG: DsbA family protein [Paracoccaceae bacterium]
MTYRLTRRAALGAALAAAVAPALGRRAEALETQGFALDDMVMGAEDAPVTIVEYSSLTCPHCATFHTRTWPEIERRFVRTGQARLIFREVYFDQLGLWGSMVARCGGEEPFFDIISTLFERQGEWSRAEDPAAELRRIGRVAGLSDERLQECLTDEAYMRRLVERFQETAGADGIRSTPSFLINGELHTGAMGVEQFAALIERHL